jgi:hypothetical protein
MPYSLEVATSFSKRRGDVADRIDRQASDSGGAQASGASCLDFSVLRYVKVKQAVVVLATFLQKEEKRVPIMLV